MVDGGPAAPSPPSPRSAFIADLRSVLSEREFRRLFATRLVSQTGDGLFNAGFAAYVFFGATTFPNPAAAAEAFAVLYLPYSLIGPFAGVFIDRWSRRQILVWSALTRSLMVAVTAGVVASGNVGVPLYIGVLAVLGVNRFFLAALSAATPHVVAEDKLVMANSVAPTSGTIVGFAGGILGLAVHLVTGGGHIGSAATLLAGGALYAAAGITGMTMARDLLGPHRDPAEPQPAGVLNEVADVARGLAAGARHLWERRKAAAAIFAIGSHRFLYGIMLLMALLLYRNYFYKGVSGNAALGHGTLVVITSAIGYGAAAIVTPIAARRMSKGAWITWLLAVGGILTGILGATFQQAAFLLAGFALGVVSQGVKICADTIVQQHVDDAYRGRVFSIYDMVFNASYVAGPAIAAVFMPVTGKSYPVVVLLCVGYLLAAAGFVAMSRGPAIRPEHPEHPEPAEPSPAPR